MTSDQRHGEANPMSGIHQTLPLLIRASVLRLVCPD